MTIIVSREAGFWSKFKGNWSPNAAKSLAKEVTSTAFNSPTFKKELDKLSDQVASKLSIKIDDISTQSSLLALNCTQKFITKQYSQTFAEVFDQKIKKSVPNPIAIGKPLISNNVMISQHKFGIGGITTIITAQISKRIAGDILERITVSITQRLLGRVASVSIPLIGEVIGGGLLLYDVVKGFNGPFPEIQSSLKSLKTKSTIRNEIVSVVEQELRNESPQISQAISTDVYAQWIEFQRED